MRKDVLSLLFVIVLILGPISRLTIGGWFLIIGVFTIFVFGIIHLITHLKLLQHSSQISKSFIPFILSSHFLYLCLFLFQSDAGDDKGYVVFDYIFGEIKYLNLESYNWTIFFISLGLYLFINFYILYKLKKKDPGFSKKEVRKTILIIIGLLVIPLGLVYLISSINNLKELKKNEALGNYENLRRALRDKGKVTSLRLYKYPNSYKEIPPGVFQLYNLDKFEMYSNQLAEIPKQIKSLKKLRSIDLSYNQIREIPDEMYSIPALEEIVLVNNNLDSISPEICKCKNLRVLYIGGPSLKSIPLCLSRLQTLEKLVVQSDSINNYMDFFGEFRYLKELSLRTYQNVIRDNKKYIKLIEKLPNTKIDIPSVVLNQYKKTNEK
ncbi:MAG TPA: leucine-rich repeat domain-containing protein [Chitinophagaceae bacterium]|nr:leucine-rich repeat domain-containing protein [Chitinophagaceae bacterium]